MPTTSGTRPSARAISRALRDYLAEAPDAKASLQSVLERLRSRKGPAYSTRSIKTSLLFTDIAESSSLFELYGDQVGRRIVGRCLSR